MDPKSVENLFFDLAGSAEGCNEFALVNNLRNISSYNFEMMKETLRVATERIKKRVLASVEPVEEQAWFENQVDLNL